MKVDADKLLYLIATDPLILAVRLADKFDCDIEDVETALLPHLNRRVFAREILAPNQRMATAYRLSDEYREQVLKSSLGVPEEERPTPSTPLAAIPGEPRVTKPKLAIDFLTVTPGNRCTTREMCKALGLPPTSSPNSYLGTALSDGRLKRDGQDWLLGEPVAAPAMAKSSFAFATPTFTRLQELAPVVPESSAPAPAVDLAPLDNVETVGNIIAAAKDASQIPQAVVDAVEVAPSTQFEELRRALEVVEKMMNPAREMAELTQSVAKLPLRYGIWSDGVLELQRGGQVVAALTREECTQVVKFLESRAA